eukprot:3931050-Rhodomonas_salina.1
MARARVSAACVASGRTWPHPSATTLLTPTPHRPTPLAPDAQARKEQMLGGRCRTAHLCAGLGAQTACRQEADGGSMLGMSRLWAGHRGRTGGSCRGRRQRARRSSSRPRR